MTFTWREQLTQTDIEALQANIARVGLVVRVRWAIVGVLVAFSALGAGVYETAGQFGGMWHQMVVPGMALGFVLLYNTFYQLNYRRLGHLTAFNVVQLLLDVAVVTLLIYYSGGVYSWFSAMYLLFILEAALILPRAFQAYIVALASAVAYGLTLMLVYYRVIPHMHMPFVHNDLQFQGSYVAVRGLWESTVMFGTATVGTLLMAQWRHREDDLAARSIYDDRTGLYNRAYFRRELGVEIERARRDRRGVSVVLADIDDFDRFNQLFGHEAGNSMLVAVAGALRGAASSGDDGLGEEGAGLVLASRYGGEEFALVVPEPKVAVRQSEGVRVAEEVCRRIGAARDDDRSVTVSVGVATYPGDGRAPAELLGAADTALAAAAAAGGNRVAVGREARGADEARD
jgi:diguanylate cyclase (GGDEF)-like protein